MNRGLKFLLALGLVLISLVCLYPTASADAVGYTVKPELPSNQLSSSVGYFDLLTKPKARQQLTVLITNTTNRQQKFDVSANQAVTNDDGVIDYGQLKPKLDSSLKVGIQNVFSKADNRRVTIPADSKKRVSLTYTMPAKPIRGMILGGVYVAQVKSNRPQAGKKIMIQNAFAYAIGIELQESRLIIVPDMVLHQVQATQINRRNYVTANLQNPEPGIMQKLTVNARVTKVDANQTLLEQKQANLGMAPNSNFNFGIPWGNQNLTAGTYTLHLAAKADGQNWQFTRNFTIANKTVKRLNKTSLAPTQKPNYLLYIILALVIALLLAVIGYLIYRNRRQKSAK